MLSSVLAQRSLLLRPPLPPLRHSLTGAAVCAGRIASTTAAASAAAATPSASSLSDLDPNSSHSNTAAVNADGEASFKILRRINPFTHLPPANVLAKLIDYPSCALARRPHTRAPYALQQPTPPLRVAFVSAEASQGHGVCIAPDGWLLVVPKVLADEVVVLKPFAHADGVSMCDLVRIITPSPHRVVPKCKLFNTCSACAFQHADYDHQLRIKTDALKLTYDPAKLGATLPDLDDVLLPFEKSPAQYGFRTKLTPHNGRIRANEPLSAIGFLQSGRHRAVVDVDRCEVATDAVNQGLKTVRSQVLGSIKNFPRLGSTYLIRQTLEPEPKQPKASFEVEADRTPRTSDQPNKLHEFMQKLKGGNEAPKKIPLHVAFSQVPTVSAQQYPPANFIARPVTSTKANLMDIVNGHVMQSPSNSFYQLNSHLLPHLCQYISSELAPFTAASNRPVSTLVDAYCGTGIFALTQSHLFKHVIGIESDKDAIAFAKVNATENGINNARFVSGKVEDMFSGVETMLQDMQAADSSRSSPTPTGDNLALVIDPPKKGCGEGFLAQVMRLQPRVIIYISCNPASQAQDLAILESFAKNGVPPASFHGSLGAIVSRGVITAAELRRVPRSHADADASMPRALYVGGKRIVLRDAPHTAGDSQVAVHVEDLDGSHAVSVAATSPSVSEPASAGLASTHSNTQIAASRVGPTTLLKFNGYSVTRIKPFDMFPQSFRSEVVTTLVRRDFVPANAMMMRQ